MGSLRRHRKGRTYGRRMSSCPPQISLLPRTATKERPASVSGSDSNISTSAAASTSPDAHPNQLTDSNNYHEHEPSRPGLLNGWTVEEILRLLEANNQNVIQQVRNVINEDRSIATNSVIDWFSQRFFPSQSQSKVAKLEKELELAHQRNLELEGEYGKIRARLGNNNTKLREVNAKLDKALRERDDQRRLADGGAIVNSAKVTDDAILDKWKMLNYNIRGLAHTLAKNPPSQLLDNTTVARLNWISTMYHKHLQDEEYREFVLQGYLWSLVNDVVFDACACPWGGPGVAELKSIRDRIIGRIDGDDFKVCSQAARWFAQGSGLHEQLWGCDSEGVRDLVATETTRLEPFYWVPGRSCEKTARQVFNDLKAIIDSAVELDQIFMCSKAIFQIHWRDRSQDSRKTQRFNAETMEPLCSDQELSAKSIVKMFISPFLHKVGNADGQNYDCRMLLAKGSVVCN